MKQTRAIVGGIGGMYLGGSFAGSWGAALGWIFGVCVGWFAEND